MAAGASQQIDRNHKVITSNEAYITHKTITFTGAANLGQSTTTTPFFNTTGHIVCNVWGATGVTLTGASAIISCGLIAGVSNQLFMSNTTATALDAGEIWTGSTPLGGAALNGLKAVLGTRQIGTVHSTADTTGGTLTLVCQWRPMPTVDASGNITYGTVTAV